MELGLDLKLWSWSWNWSWNLWIWNWSWSWYSEICRSWNWSWSWNLRSWSWSWSWYSGYLPELELELELKPREFEFEFELIFWRLAGVRVGVETSGVGVDIMELTPTLLWEDTVNSYGFILLTLWEGVFMAIGQCVNSIFSYPMLGVEGWQQYLVEVWWCLDHRTFMPWRKVWRGPLYTARGEFDSAPYLSSPLLPSCMMCIRWLSGVAVACQHCRVSGRGLVPRLASGR